MDTDGDEHINYNELSAALLERDVSAIDSQQILDLFNEIDTDGSGLIEIKELAQFLNLSLQQEVKPLWYLTSDGPSYPDEMVFQGFVPDDDGRFGDSAAVKAKKWAKSNKYLDGEWISDKLLVDRGSIFDVGKSKKPCLLYTSPSPRDGLLSRMPSSA